jgi:glycerol-3-phosphate dehydrogenase
MLRRESGRTLVSSDADTSAAVRRAADVFDIFVIGGGVNGAGIARDAAGRGFSVFLAEQNDLGSGTSSWSTKLIHGGLRYLEYYEFRLVREALAEREVLLGLAPHIIRPQRFVLPLGQNTRPGWLIRLGLFLYDNIGGRRLLPPTATLDLTRDPAGRALKPAFRRAFEYSDCTVDDTRLVVLNARDAADRGAVIRTRTRVTAARRENGVWAVTAEDRASGETRTVRARALVNASGPWVDRVLGGFMSPGEKRNVRLVQGSHIVVRRRSDDPRAFFFQNPDKRIFFAIPYQDRFTLIGTTDRDFSGDPGEARISDEEIDYLLAAADEYLREPLTRADIVWTFSGVRPLYDDGATSAQEATRDYVLKADGAPGEAPLFNIFGGKITTYRRLSEAMLGKIEGFLGARGKPWTAAAPLPGGDFAPDAFESGIARLQADYPFLAPPHARRLFRLYGTRAARILGAAKSLADLGRHFGGDLYEAEVAYAMREEWAADADDVLWRRTKLGLVLSAEEAAALDAWMGAGTGARSASAAAE